MIMSPKEVPNGAILDKGHGKQLKADEKKTYSLYGVIELEPRS